MDATDLISLELMREHTRAYADEVSDDLIKAYANAALAFCMSVCDDAQWDSPGKVPAQVKAAVLLYLGDFNLNREAQGTQQIFTNRLAKDLLLSARNWYGGALPEDSKE